MNEPELEPGSEEEPQAPPRVQWGWVLAGLAVLAYGFASIFRRH